jgi:hypothetical protein
VQRAPGIPRSPLGVAPRPLLGGSFMHNSGASRREKVKVCLSYPRHCEPTGRARWLAMRQAIVRGVLDTLLEPVIGLAGGETRWRRMTASYEAWLFEN